MSCESEDAVLPAVTRGDKWEFDIELVVGDVADDLTDASIRVVLKSDLAAADVDAQLNYEFQVTAGADATGGVATVVVPSDQTNLVPAGRYYLGLIRVHPGTPPDVWTFYRQRSFSVLERFVESP